MIKSVAYTGVPGITDNTFEFREDLNVFTGENGTGKTTILKLMWYLYSSNLYRAIADVNFTTVKLSTSDYTISIHRELSDKYENIRLVLDSSGDESIVRDGMVPIRKPDEPPGFIAEVQNFIRSYHESSIFFPTFRRLEGGFSLDKSLKSYPFAIQTDTVAEAIAKYSEMMSVDDHLFVSSISTSDIEKLINDQFSSFMQDSLRSSVGLSDFITKEIHKYDRSLNISQNPDDSDLKDVQRLVDAIRTRVNENNEDRGKRYKPFDVLSDVVGEIFKSKGVTVRKNSLTFGQTTSMVTADKLSAGEKQMLGFLCYNIFVKKGPFFIDEPELSLHTDWQSMLLPVLIEQGTQNQFFIATHSMLIYSKYPDREIRLPLRESL
ncbi:MAG: AAA family ATPase [Bacteroidota bacterium]